MPAVTIGLANPAVCEGEEATFNAVVTNGGSKLLFQWEVNGKNEGTNSSQFTGAFQQNDAVTCTLTNTADCNIPQGAVSGTYLIVMTPVVTPSVLITETDPILCQGMAATFKAVAVNAGSLPDYQWQVNGVNAGINNQYLTPSDLKNDDRISCVITANGSCLAVPTATSNPISIILNPLISPVLTVSQLTDPVCSGSDATFSAVTAPLLQFPVYDWQVNGISQNINSATFYQQRNIQW